MKNVTSPASRTPARCGAWLTWLIIAVSLSSLSISGRAVSLISTLGQPLSVVNLTENASFAIDFLTGSEATTVTSFTLHLANLDPDPRTFSGEIWSDRGSAIFVFDGVQNVELGQPGSRLDAFDTPITVPASSPNFQNYTGFDPGISLAPNTRHWFVIHVGEPHVSAPFALYTLGLTTGQDVNAGGKYTGVSSMFSFFIGRSSDEGLNWDLVLLDSSPLYELAGDVVSSSGGTSVPDSSSTLPLFGLAFAGLASVHRRSASERRIAEALSTTRRF